MSTIALKRQISSIMDDGADKDHSEPSSNSEDEQKQTQPNIAKDKAADSKDDGGGRVRGGSVIQQDDDIFGADASGKKRSNSIEATRPRARQEHSNVF